MSWRASPRLAAGVAAALVWALAAASVLLWFLRIGSVGAPDAVPVAGQGAGMGPVDVRQVAQALGAADAGAARSAPAPDVLARLKLHGVVTQNGRGAALISVDGKPAKPVRAGAALPDVGGGWAVQTLAPHAVVLAADGRQARLEMPPLDQRPRGDALFPDGVPPAAPAQAGQWQQSHMPAPQMPQQPPSAAQP